MHRIATLCACLVALTASPVFAADEQPATQRLPLAIVGRVRIERGKIPDTTPLLTIGGLVPAADLTEAPKYPPTPTNWEPLPPYRDYSDPLIKDLMAGDKHLFQSDSGQETLIYVVGPEDSFECYFPLALSREGKRFTLEMVSGTMDIPRDATPEPTRVVYLISLGKLEAGAYQLDLRLAEMTGNEQSYPLYAHHLIDTGSVPFTVGDGLVKHREQPAPPAQLKVTDLKSQRDEREGLLCQMPESLPIAGKAGKGEAVSVEVGGCDGYAWISAAHAQDEVPELKPPQGREQLCALVHGPDLNTGEFMSLRDVVWHGTTATINVELWRDHGVRKQNAKFGPLLLVPVTPQTGMPPPPTAPAVKVLVTFHELTAPDQGKPYTEDTEKDFKHAEAITETAR